MTPVAPAHVACTVDEAVTTEISAMVQKPRIKPEIVFTLSSPTLSCVVLARPLKFAAASTAVPDSVGLAERTLFPVPVDVVTPVPPDATARAFPRVSVPMVEACENRFVLLAVGEKRFVVVAFTRVVLPAITRLPAESNVEVAEPPK